MVEPSNFTLYTSAGPSAGLLVQTNPISDGDNVGQALSHAGVTDDSSPDRLEKTKPISQGVSSLKCQVSSEESQLAEPPGPPSSPCQLHSVTRQFSRQTNPISDDENAGQVLSKAGVTDDASPDRPAKTKPICPAKAGPPSVTPAQAGVQESRGVNGLGTPNAMHRVWEPFPPARE